MTSLIDIMTTEHYSVDMTNRYYRDFTITMLAYSALLVLAIELVHSHDFATPLKAAIGLTPVLPLIYGVKLQMDRFRLLDELEQRIMSESIVFAFACTAIVVITYGFLQIFIDAPAVSWLWVWPVQGALWLIGRLIASRPYAA